MLLDPVAEWSLAQRIDDVLPGLSDRLGERVAGETHGSAVELSTDPHLVVSDVIEQVRRLRAILSGSWLPWVCVPRARGPIRSRWERDEDRRRRSAQGRLWHDARTRPPRADVRTARAHRRRRPEAGHRLVQPAARPSRPAAGGRHQLAVLAGPRHRPRLRAGPNLPGVSARRGSPPISRLLGATWGRSTCCCVARRFPSQPCCGGRATATEVRDRGGGRDGCPAHAGEHPQTLVALLQSIAPLELEEGYLARIGSGAPRCSPRSFPRFP